MNNDDIRAILEQKITAEEWAVAYHTKELSKAETTLSVFRGALDAYKEVK